MRKTILSLLMVSIIITTFAVPSASAKPSVLSLLQACNITVDKKVLFTQEDDEARSATIKLACDTKKVNYDDIVIKPIGDQVTASKAGNIISVKAQAGGAGYVLLENNNYIGVKVRFRVFQKFNQETVEQRIKPELTNTEKALVSEYVLFKRQNAELIESTEIAIELMSSEPTNSLKYYIFETELLPKVRQVKYQLKLLKPQTAEYQSIHKLLMQTADLQIEAFTLYKQAFSNEKINAKLFKKGADKNLTAMELLRQANLQILKAISKMFTFIEEI